MRTALLLFILGMAETRANCPASCNCTQTSVSCVKRHLETVPILDSLETSPKVLDFSGNSLIYISQEDFDFPKSDKVIEVYLNSSSLAEMGQGTFDNLNNLQTLHLGDNLLPNSEVPSTIVQNLENIMMLDLSKNQLQGDMPIIRSESLVMLGLVNSKISSVPDNALEFLPNLKVLLLEQNDLTHLSVEPFKNCKPGFMVKLAYNPWTCDCSNLEAFYRLADRTFIDKSDAYQCTDLRDNKINNMFDIDEIMHIVENCTYFNARFTGKSLETEKPPTKEEPCGEDDDDNDKDNAKKGNKRESDKVIYQGENVPNKNKEEGFTARMSENCWHIFTATFSNNGMFTAVAIAAVTSFLIGFVFGVVFCRVFYIFRYKHLDQTDSQVELLRA